MHIFIKRRNFALKLIHFAADLLNCNSVGSYCTDAEKIQAMKFIHKVADNLYNNNEAM